ncbi:O-antigen ligase family protein [Rhodococcus sp. AB351]|uniref:O-antigen ligase family protein n=1 Tax=Rhodococcus sp. AB351 TaxID=3413280 RepID=UPI003C27F901
MGLLLGLAAATTGVVSFLPMFGVRPWHIFAGLALVIAILSTPAGTVRSLRLGLLDLAFGLFAVGSLLAEFINSSEVGYFDFIGAINPAFFLVGYFAARIAVTGRSSAYEALRMYCIPAILAGLVSVAQLGSVSFSQLVLRIAPGPGLQSRIIDGRLIRATGFVGHWTGLGFYFCSVLAAGCAALLLARNLGGRPPRSIYWCLGAAVLGAVSSLTLSAIMTAVAIALVTMFVIGLKPSRLLILAGVALVVYMQFGSLLGERVTQQTAYRKEYVPDWVPNTIAYRWKIWTEQTVPVLQERLWTGWGSNIYSTADRPRRLVWGSPESQWLGTAMTSGMLVAGILGVTLIVALLLIGRSAWSSVQSRWQLPVGVLLSCALVSSFTVPVFTNRGLPVGLWFIIGVVVAAGATYKNYVGDPGIRGEFESVKAAQS